MRVGICPALYFDSNDFLIVRGDDPDRPLSDEYIVLEREFALVDEHIVEGRGVGCAEPSEVLDDQGIVREDDVELHPLFDRFLEVGIYEVPVEVHGVYEVRIALDLFLGEYLLEHFAYSVDSFVVLECRFFDVGVFEDLELGEDALRHIEAFLVDIHDLFRFLGEEKLHLFFGRLVDQSLGPERVEGIIQAHALDFGIPRYLAHVRPPGPEQGDIDPYLCLGKSKEGESFFCFHSKDDKMDIVTS